MAIEPVPVNVNGWIEVSELGTALVLRIGGELDGESRGSIEPALMAAVGSASSVVVDLSELTFCDSRGLAMFIAALDKATAAGTAFSIRNVAPRIRRLFEVTGLDAMIDTGEGAG